MFVSFLILGWMGTRIYEEAPPFAAKVVTTDSTVVIDEGDGFYGFPPSEWLPYSVTRSWHIQMGLFWIAPIGWQQDCSLAR